MVEVARVAARGQRGRWRGRRQMWRWGATVTRERGGEGGGEPEDRRISEEPPSITTRMGPPALRSRLSGVPLWYGYAFFVFEGGISNNVRTCDNT